MPKAPSELTIYIAGSFKHLHGVRLLGAELAKAGCRILDWTAKASPPPGLNAVQRREWMDTDMDGGQVYSFCKNACLTADLLVYYGASGQDAGVEVGMAASLGTPILGIRGPLESPGLMLHGAVSVWTDDATQVAPIVRELCELKSGNWENLDPHSSRPAHLLGRLIKSRLAETGVPESG